MHVTQRLSDVLDQQRGHLFPWSPVLFATGIGGFFTLKEEPTIWLLWTFAGCAVISFLCAIRYGATLFGPVVVALALIAAGFSVAGWRTHSVAAPVLEWRYYGPIEGRVIGLDRSASDAVRVTLDRVTLPKLSPDEMPVRVRVSLHGAAAGGPDLRPGAHVMTTGHVSPPGGPVEPGGFDFQRHSWFGQLGGVGYTRVPMVNAGPPQTDDWAGKVFRVRLALSRFVQNSLSGDIGGFGAAVTSGDRSGMGQDALKALRASNLAHLLAISGLHMGLLTGCVFAALRIVLSAIPFVALYWPTKRIAAVGALIAATGYFILSGGNVSTERAYAMAAVALFAVMLDRRAISIRAVAIAAMIVLFLRPEALLGPGFQMSFAATVALVAVFNAIRDSTWSLPRWLQPVSAVFISSAVAGLATAPFAAAHFNAVSHYGLFANVLSVPVMGIVVVPAAVLSAVLSLVGLADIGLQIMGLGLWWILEVAAYVAGLPGARSFVVGPGPWVLPMIAAGGMGVVLIQGRGRWVGVLPMIVAFGLWSQSTRPQILIADTGGLVGVMTDAGRALSRAKGSGFVATNWLENDGDMSAQFDAFDRWSKEWPVQAAPVTAAELGNQTVWHVTGKKASATVAKCPAAILVSNAKLSADNKSCVVFDPDSLRRSGAVALDIDAQGIVKITTAREIAGDRIWSGWPK